ncbi:unnamed protein product [Phaeothamnion confervicola]
MSAVEAAQRAISVSFVTFLYHILCLLFEHRGFCCMTVLSAAHASFVTFLLSGMVDLIFRGGGILFTLFFISFPFFLFVCSPSPGLPSSGSRMRLKSLLFGKFLSCCRPIPGLLWTNPRRRFAVRKRCRLLYH